MTLPSDIMRWWAFLGAVVAFPQAVLWLRLALAGIPHGPLRAPWAELSKVFFLAFVLLAGGAIPLTSRISGFDMDNPIFQTIMLVAWTCVALSAWSFNFARVPHFYLQLASSVGTLGLVSFVAWWTYV